MSDELICKFNSDSEDHSEDLRRVQNMIDAGNWQGAKEFLVELRSKSLDARSRSIVCANLGVLDAIHGRPAESQGAFEAAILIDRGNSAARDNLAEVIATQISEPPGIGGHAKVAGGSRCPESPRTKIAILSLLFNWPSTGGGTIHTKELAENLSHSGFDVLHVFAQYDTWQIGRYEQRLSVPTKSLKFDDDSWRLENIIVQFRAALKEFSPDYVIVTDSWNSKPWLAAAADEFPVILRYQALENLCPLNNIRLLPTVDGTPQQCGRHQLATPFDCHQCCISNSRYSGFLHQRERDLCRVGTAEYDTALRRSLTSAHAVLVVNPLMQAMLSPWNKQTLVVPSGMDPERFSISQTEATGITSHRWRTRLLFAGLTSEYMKGFHVLLQACDLLWSKRKDFELIVTGEVAEQLNEYTVSVGWLSQEQLAMKMREVDILVFPTIAQEALGRSAVEAMGAGLPIVASRIGGLSFTVTDGLTGLLATPGDPIDLAKKLEMLLNDPDLRRTLGANGRVRFENEFAWPTIIARHYRPLFTANTK